MTEEAAPTITIEDAAELCKCEPARVEELLRLGVLTGLKLGRSWIIPRQAFIARLNEIAVEQAEERRRPRPPREPTPPQSDGIRKRRPRANVE